LATGGAHGVTRPDSLSKAIPRRLDQIADGNARLASPQAAGRDF
jgi:hypothetical protein